MAYIPAQRNYGKVQFENLRKEVDPVYTDLHDRLSETYYDFWKKGLDKEVNLGGNLYNRQPTPEESKALFDELHGLIEHKRVQKMNDTNSKKAKKDKDIKFEEQISRIDETTGKTGLDISLDKIAEIENKGLRID